MELRGHLKGHNVEEIQYMLFHKAATDPLLIPSIEGQFYYNTTNQVLEIKDASSWVLIPKMTALQPSGGRLMIGTYATLTGFNSGLGFVKTSNIGVPSVQQYITLEDLLSSDITTAISSPGTNNTLVTEKAVVDYFNAASLTPLDDILHWDGGKYAPFNEKKSVDFPYFFISSDNPTNNEILLKLDAQFKACSVFAIAVGDIVDTEAVLSPGGISISKTDKNTGISFVGSLSLSEIGNLTLSNIKYDAGEATSKPIYIGYYQEVDNINGKHILIDDFNQLFTINFPSTEIPRGSYTYHRQTLGTDTNGDWRTYSNDSGYYIEKRIAGVWTSTPVTGLTSFLELTDVIPTTYVGNAGKVPTVNTLETGLDFTDSVLARFIYLADAPSSYLGHANKVVVVNAGANALEFSSSYLLSTTAASTYIPYTGGTSNVNLGAHNLVVDTDSLFVDSVNHRVGIKNLSPLATLDLIGTVRFGDSTTNYTKFEADGTMVMVGAATVFDDLTADITRAKIVGTRVAFNDAENTLDFTNACTLTDYVVTNYQMTHKWKLGSNIFPHIHWEQTSNATPNWLIQYRWQKNSGAKTTAWTNYKCTTNAYTYVSGTLNQISYGAALTPPVGYSMSDILEFRVTRDTANTSAVFSGVDTYTGTVSITACDIHTECDSIGSHSEYSK